jgi:hypothetical protein
LFSLTAGISRNRLKKPGHIQISIAKLSKIYAWIRLKRQANGSSITVEFQGTVFCSSILCKKGGFHFLSFLATSQ